MAKKTTEQGSKESGEQLDLIDVAPENAKVIVAAVRVYKRLQTTRLAALAEEVEQKNKVQKLVKEAKLQRLPNGTIKFSYGDVTVIITPKDDLITITEKAAK